MLMITSFIAPIVASVLYVIVFQKAGFRGAILAVCAAPIVSMALSQGLMRLFYFGGRPMLAFVLVSIGLSLLPLLVLAFKSWPPVVMPQPKGDE